MKMNENDENDNGGEIWWMMKQRNVMMTMIWISDNEMMCRQWQWHEKTSNGVW